FLTHFPSSCLRIASGCQALGALSVEIEGLLRRRIEELGQETTYGIVEFDDDAEDAFDIADEPEEDPLEDLVVRDEVEEPCADESASSVAAHPSSVSDIRAYLNHSGTEELAEDSPEKPATRTGRRSRSKKMAAATA
ncbi:hypothetical protein FOZ62_023856, partial [Perkinsus olseni]